MKAGEILTEDDLDYKRPGTGISPAEVRYVIGRTMTRDIDEDRVLVWEDLV